MAGWQPNSRSVSDSRRREQRNPAVTSKFLSFLQAACDATTELYNLKSIDVRPFVTIHDCCSAVKEVKKVLSGPLDDYLSTGNVKWLCPLDTLSWKERIGLLATWASAKKGMPDPCNCSVLQQHVAFEKNASTPLVPDEKYMKHVERTVKQIFGRGWARNYKKRVEANSPSLAACAESGRDKLGAYGATSKERLDSIALGKERIGSFNCQLTSVVSDGKSRILVKTPADWNAFRPLHETIYDHISRQKWLLRGTPSLRKIRRVVEGMSKRQLVLSGDYESATDMLSIEVAELIIKTMMKQAGEEVPETLVLDALKSLRPLIIDEKRDRAFVLRRGQMMGSLLSFPLLCLQNYIATTYILGPRSMLINGDDLLTVCTKGEYRKWCLALPALGLKPSMGKCGLLRSFFTINSTYFQIERGRVTRAKFCRLKAILRPAEGVPDQGALSNAREGMKRGGLRQRFDALYLRANYRRIQKSGRSLLLLGLDVVPEAVTRQMCVREWSLRSHLAGLTCERKLPPSPSPHSGVSGLPEGFKRMALRSIPEAKKEWIPLVLGEQPGIWARGKCARVGLAKTLAECWKDWWDEVAVTGLRPVRIARRLRAHDIGPVLRDLTKKRKEEREPQVLVPESWKTKGPRWVKSGVLGSSGGA